MLANFFPGDNNLNSKSCAHCSGFTITPTFQDELFVDFGNEDHIQRCNQVNEGNVSYALNHDTWYTGTTERQNATGAATSKHSPKSHWICYQLWKSASWTWPCSHVNHPSHVCCEIAKTMNTEKLTFLTESRMCLGSVWRSVTSRSERSGDLCDRNDWTVKCPDQSV